VKGEEDRTQCSEAGLFHKVGRFTEDFVGEKEKLIKKLSRVRGGRVGWGEEKGSGDGGSALKEKRNTGGGT